MTNSTELRISYDLGCLKSLKNLPDRATKKFMELMMKFMSNPAACGINFETIEGARDSKLKSMRVDLSWRAIAVQSGRDIMFLHVNEHDAAYAWANRRKITIDPQANRIRIVEEVESTTSALVSPAPHKALFAEISDDRLLGLGVLSEELPRIRALSSSEELSNLQDSLDPLTFDILQLLDAGFTDEDIKEHHGLNEPSSSQTDDLTDLIDAGAASNRIYVPANEEELQRFLEGDLANWRVFLHPSQKKIVDRSWNGPVLVRGGAGTGKTVVAMHRAKWLADKLAKDLHAGDKRVLVTTFTTSLAQDIEANLRTLCPEHLTSRPPRIEVTNLDRWVGDFLRARNYPRQIVYFSTEQRKLEEAWRKVFDEMGTPEGLSEDFIRAEWSQIVLPRGITQEQDWLRAPRTGRGTPLDRRKRVQLWRIFTMLRTECLSLGIAEPDDAYREATALLSNEAQRLPYAAVVVDEAQDMGEQAFRLIRAIAPPDVKGDANRLFIVGDAHQRIYGRKTSMTACGIEVRGRSKRLKLNYRTSDEIRKWAISALEGVNIDDLDEGIDSFSGYTSVFNGPGPQLCAFASETEELEALVAWIIAQQKEGIELKDIGVLTHTNDQVERVSAALSSQKIPSLKLAAEKSDDRAVDGVRLATMHRSKGLEFKLVALPFMSNTRFPPKFLLEKSVDAVDRLEIEARFRSLLHVAATRAKYALRVSWSGEQTPLMAKAEPK